jgi:hypothetical protein
MALGRGFPVDQLPLDGVYTSTMSVGWFELPDRPPIA